MENKIDLFVSYSYRTRRNKENKDDAYVGLIVQEGYEVPERPTRSMIESLRNYLAGQNQVKPNQIRIENIIRLEPEVIDVPEQESQVDGPVGPPGVPGGPPEIPRELADAMSAALAASKGGAVQDADGEGSPGEVDGEGV
jgi:hypothetical protein